MISNKSVLTLGLCPTHTGAKEPIVHVCMDESCKASPLICFLCRAEAHAGHTTISLGKFAEDVDQLRFSEGGPEATGKIKDAKASCLDVLKQTRQKIIAAIDKAESEVMKQFEKAQDEL